MKHTIAIVDDHSLIADFLSDFISEFMEFEVLFTCINGMEFQNKINDGLIPDIVLLDISMPVMDGFETSQWIKNFYPDMKVLVLSMESDEQSLIKMIKNGAKGYLLKNIKKNELKKALIELINRGYYFPEWVGNKVILSVGSDGIESSNKIILTDREKEFLRYVATDLTYKEIADKMCCSPRTVENYRNSLFEKLDVKSRVMLAVYALKNGYAD